MCHQLREKTHYESAHTLAVHPDLNDFLHSLRILAEASKGFML